MEKKPGTVANAWDSCTWETEADSLALCQGRWRTLVIPVLKRLRWTYHKFETSMGYTGRSCLQHQPTSNPSVLRVHIHSFCFFEKGSQLSTPGCSPTHRDLPIFACWVLGLEACTSNAWHWAISSAPTHSSFPFFSSPSLAQAYIQLL